jgi:hypothetical protein
VVLEPAGEAFPDRFPIDDLIGVGGHQEAGSWVPAVHLDGGSDENLPALSGQEPVDAPTPVAFWDDLVGAGDSHPEGVVPETASGADGASDEVLRQTSWLSPQAAEAIAAALHTTPPHGYIDGDAPGPDAAGGLSS